MNERKELIARLRNACLAYEPPDVVVFDQQQAADMLEADAQSIDVAYSQGFIEGERAAIVSQAASQWPVAYLAWRDGKPCWEGDDCVCAHAVYPVDHDDDRTSMPVYLAPHPQRPRLTDAEIKAIEHETDMKSSIGDWSNYFARAIEAKVRGEA